MGETVGKVGASWGWLAREGRASLLMCTDRLHRCPLGSGLRRRLEPSNFLFLASALAAAALDERLVGDQDFTASVLQAAPQVSRLPCLSYPRRGSSGSVERGRAVRRREDG